MYKGTLSKKRELLIHFVFWLLTAYFNFVSNPFSSKISIQSLFYTTYLIVFVTTFYFHYLIVMRLVFKSFNWKKLFMGIAVSYLFFTGLRFLIEQNITLSLFGKTNYINPSFVHYLADNLKYSSSPIMFGSFLWFTIYFIRLLEYNKYILEENKNAEIKFLKAQINPHFIFNTLNNIYSMVYFKSDKALDALEKLGNIMRFTTYESQKDKIAIQEEMNYINAYIELEQLRHSEQNFVRFETESENQKTIMISPYILSPLVENALKHGVISNEKPIKIALLFNDETLNFKVINHVGTHKKDKLGGVGIDNLQKRLDIHYPNKNKLENEEKNGIYTTNLQIDLR